MENKLKLLFDFQDFQKNSYLAQLIEQTEKRHGEALSDDDLSFVSAAGDFTPKQHGKDRENDFDS